MLNSRIAVVRQRLPNASGDSRGLRYRPIYTSFLDISLMIKHSTKIR
jgi:hypothetical protein